ncbi:MAG: hypothetical protein H0X31_00330 [Nostocaceae cyanobacterium]|nr:hypothetical protein [Nostocaceae cyanobacterium]
MQDAVSKGDASQMSQEYKETLNAIFTRIKNSAVFDKKELDNRILIKIGRENVFRSIMGEEPLENRLTQENVEQLNTALNNPENLKGSVSISIGNERLFHAKNGEVIKDSLKLVPERKQAENLKKEKVEKQTIESLQAQVASLEERAREQQETIKSLSDKPSPTKDLTELLEAITKQQETLDSIQTRLEKAIVRQAPASQNSKLQDWIGTVESKVKDGIRGIWNKVTDSVTPKINNLQEQVDNRLSSLGAKANEINQKFDNTFKEAKGKMLVECASRVFSVLGERQDDGSVRYESKNYVFTQKDKQLSVIPKDGRGVEVLNNNGFTSSATDNDITSLQKVEEAAEQLKVDHAPSQSRSLKL